VDDEDVDVAVQLMNFVIFHEVGADLETFENVNYNNKNSNSNVVVSEAIEDVNNGNTTDDNEEDDELDENDDYNNNMVKLYCTIL
jgi:hypothetical protein